MDADGNVWILAAFMFQIGALCACAWMTLSAAKRAEKSSHALWWMIVGSAVQSVASLLEAVRAFSIRVAGIGSSVRAMYDMDLLIVPNKMVGAWGAFLVAVVLWVIATGRDPICIKHITASGIALSILLLPALAHMLYWLLT